MIRRRFLGALFVVAAAPIAAPHAHEDGPEFTTLVPPQPTESGGKIEVIEFFWYGCPHCSSLEPVLEAWERRLAPDVVLRREPVVWNGRRETEAHARLFATLSAMHLLAQHHRAAFDATHKEKLRLADEAQLFGWAARRGIDRAKFEATYRSFGVNVQAARAAARTRSFQVEGVPSFVVNGKFVTSLSNVHDPVRLFAILDKLVAGERRR